MMSRDESWTDDGIRTLIAGLMRECTVVDRPREMIFRGVPVGGTPGGIREVRRLIRARDGSYYRESIDGTDFLVVTFPKYRIPPRRWGVHLALFLATILTTAAMGAVLAGADPIRDLLDLREGIPFSAAILGILLCHEMGHFFAARRYGLDVTLPYFIPFPTIFGTMGAFIKIRSPIHNRRMLLEIGAAGPLAGLLVAIPAVVYGLRLSTFGVAQDGGITLGSSLLFMALERIVAGPTPEGMDLFLHPVAFAGWGGLFVTALNLLPIGQLDGGHVGYALFGGLQKRISRAFFFVLIPLGWLWPGWLVWVVLILLLIKIPHPPVIYEEIPIGGWRKVVGWFVILFFLLTFIPVPMPL